MVERADASTEQLVDRDWFSVVAPGAHPSPESPRSPTQLHPSRQNFGPKRNLTTTDARSEGSADPLRDAASPDPSPYLPHDTTPKTISTSLPSASPRGVRRARHPRCRSNRPRPRGRCGRGLGRGRRGAQPVGSPDATDTSNRGSRQHHRERDTRAAPGGDGTARAQEGPQGSRRIIPLGEGAETWRTR